MSTCATILTVPPVGVRLRRVDGELRITASGRLSLARLGIGQDAQGKIHMMGNVSAVPFGNGGVFSAGEVFAGLPPPLKALARQTGRRARRNKPGIGMGAPQPGLTPPAAGPPAPPPSPPGT